MDSVVYRKVMKVAPRLLYRLVTTYILKLSTRTELRCVGTLGGSLGSWSQLISAAVNSPKFTKLISGCEVNLKGIGPIHMKVLNVEPVVLASEVKPLAPFVFRTEIIGTATEYGYGEGPSKLVAIQKSIAEAFERLTFRLLKNNSLGTSTTNGWACHVNTDSAAQNSLFELCERDAVLTHWLKKVPFVEIESGTFPAEIKKWKIANLNQSHLFKRLRIFVTIEGHVPVVLTMIEGFNGETMISHSSGNNLSAATIQAIGETCRFASNFSNRFFETGSRALFEESSSENVLPMDHGLLYAYHLDLPEWFFGRSIPWAEAKKNWTTSPKLKSIDFNFHQIVGDPLVVGYGTSRDLQGLYFGQTTDALKNGEINFLRLNKSGSSELNLMPHFIG